jgi:Ca-activated chloride channel family protein
MAKAAQFGRGSHTMIGDVREVAQKMGALLVKLESPVLTDIAIAWPGRAEAYPASVPDLYVGEPIVVSAALDSLDGEVVVTGTLDGKRWQARLPLAADASAPGIGALWARAKIDALQDRLHEGHAEEGVRAAIVEVALAHHLVSKYTSLVAVDVTPTLPEGATTASSAMPVNLPDGMSFDAIFGGGPQTATPATIELLVGLGALLAAAVVGTLAQRAVARVH